MAGMMCVAAIGSDLSAAQINQTIIAAGGYNVATLDALPVDDTCTLVNFGFDGATFCADECCFALVTDINAICGLVLTQCDTGTIVDFRPDVLAVGLYCNDTGQVCLRIKCWTPPAAQCAAEPEIDIDWCCGDPCELACQLQNAVMRIGMGQHTVSYRNQDKSVTRSAPSLAFLESQLARYNKLCRRCRPQSRLLFYRPQSC